MAKKPSPAPRPSGAVPAQDEDRKALAAALGKLSSGFDKLSTSVVQAASGEVVRAGASALGGVAAATGNKELETIAGLLSAIAPVLEKLVSKWFPDFVLGLKSISDVQRAGDRVGALAGEAAAFGAPIAKEILKALLDAETSAENKRSEARLGVANLVTDAQVDATRRLVTHK